jgi:hypothetical protein
MMSSFISGDQRVLRQRKGPQETSSKAKTARAPFAEGEVVKELSIPLMADRYKYNMGTIDEFDHLTA